MKNWNDLIGLLSLGVPNRHVSGTFGPAETSINELRRQIVRRHPEFLLVQKPVLSGTRHIGAYS
jgi:hypothetical protein